MYTQREIEKQRQRNGGREASAKLRACERGKKWSGLKYLQIDRKLHQSDGARHGQKFSNLKFSANDAKSLFGSIRLFSPFSVTRFSTRCRCLRCCFCCSCWLHNFFFHIIFIFRRGFLHHFKRVPSAGFPADILSYIHILYLLLHKESCCLCHSWQSHHRSNSFSVSPFVKYFWYRMYLSCMIVRAAHIRSLVLLVIVGFSVSFVHARLLLSFSLLFSSSPVHSVVDFSTFFFILFCYFTSLLAFTLVSPSCFVAYAILFIIKVIALLLRLLLIFVAVNVWCRSTGITEPFTDRW